MLFYTGGQSLLGMKGKGDAVTDLSGRDQDPHSLLILEVPHQPPLPTVHFIPDAIFETVVRFLYFGGRSERLTG